MGTALERHSAVTDLKRKGEGFGVPGLECDGMDVADTYAVIGEAVRIAREERQPMLVEAETYRFRGHSMADPEEYRTKEQVAEWRRRDPLVTFGDRLVEDGVLTQEERERMDADAIERVDAAVRFADDSPFPEAEALYDDVYVLGGQVRGLYSYGEAESPTEGQRPAYEQAVEDATRDEVVRENPAEGGSRPDAEFDDGVAPEGAS
jgi:TPP-dependent pyruvate/acetoin dehydrogenase alpha subunit